jgi:methylase of polypeptide subunit release factors
VRLWLLGDVVADRDVARALPMPDARPLLEHDGDRLRAGYDLTPYADDDNDWWVVSDRVRRDRPLRPDHVVGVGAAATTLAQLTVRRPAARALDLGTGCGVQALHLSTHCGAVTATDVSERARSLAATTFALSGVRVRLTHGDLVTPVRDETFDLVVCNPPFVVGPAGRYVYRDGAAGREAIEGDDMSRLAIRSAADVLADDGVAHLLVNWLHVRDEDWRDRVSSWVVDLACDAWLIQREVSEPEDYVRTWLADTGDSADRPAGARWLRWFEGRRIDAVGLGWVVLRRSAGPHRIAVEDARHEVGQPLGPHIADWLDATAWLRQCSDADLLATAFLVSPDAVLREVSAPDDKGWRTVSRSLERTTGWRWQLPCDEAVAALVRGCDGSRALSALTAVLQVSTAEPADLLEAAACAAVRGLVDRGILLPSREKGLPEVPGA